MLGLFYICAWILFINNYFLKRCPWNNQISGLCSCFPLTIILKDASKSQVSEKNLFISIIIKMMWVHGHSEVHWMTFSPCQRTNSVFFFHKVLCRKISLMSVPSLHHLTSFVSFLPNIACMAGCRVAQNHKHTFCSELVFSAFHSSRTINLIYNFPKFLFTSTFPFLRCLVSLLFFPF